MSGTRGAAPGERFMWERLWAGAALGAAFSFCEDQSQQRGSGVREAGWGIPPGSPPSAPLLSTAVPSRAPKAAGYK